MGLNIGSLLSGLIGPGGLREAVEVFRPNAEAGAGRDQERFLAALAQLAAERGGEGAFNRAVDGLNRLPRPLLAFGTIGLFAFAMIAPAAFAVRISALALVPEPMWWLLGAIVGFYFGARELEKSRGAGVARVMGELAEWRAGTAAETAAPRPLPVERAAAPEAADPVAAAVAEANPALEEWRRGMGGSDRD
ncbi:holin family protein [Defluviimonas sp. D31]|uniref:holin family protein n=1 Tax=Defluviimonas sp. D31 TaxID=3083253 RepID=UPI00296F6F1A|nr:holin family protein [Defluviimonas sp. D31]MDW4550894.1 holin family protein [Defluviimonas sp. D31]